MAKANEAGAAPYEPMQLRPLALQARFNLEQAINQHRASWRQMVAGMGLPDMPPAELEGRVDLPIPTFNFEKVREHMLERHTDVLTAKNSIHKGDFLVKLRESSLFPTWTCACWCKRITQRLQTWWRRAFR